MSALQAFRGEVLHCLADPQGGRHRAIEYLADGLLVVENGKVAGLGEAEQLLPLLPDGVPVRDFDNALITPGFIDCHLHLPQVLTMGSGGLQLLDWLERYTFPGEARFADVQHAAAQAEFFVRELLRNGVTTAQVFGSVHAHSVDALFRQAQQFNLRMIAGKVLMDRNAPKELRDTAESGISDSRELIERWHGTGRLHYAITPRFAPTSTPRQLELAGRLLRDYPSLYLHSHLSENQAEIDWVRDLFPQCRDYLDVYEHFGLVGPRSLFAHGVHLQEDECRRLGQSGAALAFCPDANLFLGSGLFNLAQVQQHGIRVGLGSDIGAGTSFSPLRTISQGYKVLQLQGQTLDVLSAFYLATLGGARALWLDGQVGNLQLGKDADFVVLDYRATPLLAQRAACASSLEEKLSVLMMLGDDRCVLETFVAGNSVHRR